MVLLQQVTKLTILIETKTIVPNADDLVNKVELPGGIQNPGTEVVNVK